MSQRNISSTNLFDLTYVNSKEVSCDGGNLSGHPLVYLHIKDKTVVCPYCSKAFTTNHDLHKITAANKKQTRKN